VWEGLASLADILSFKASFRFTDVGLSLLVLTVEDNLAVRLVRAVSNAAS